MEKVTYYLENKADHARAEIFSFGNECEVSYFDDEFSAAYTPLTEDEERYMTAEEERDYFLSRGFVELHLDGEGAKAFSKSIEDAFMR